MKPILRGLVPMLIISFSIVANAQEQQPMLGLMAPSFTLKALWGKTYSLEQLRGKYVVIHFAATWCPFCNAEAPFLEELYRNYGNKNVKVFIVDIKEDKALVEKSLERFQPLIL